MSAINYDFFSMTQDSLPVSYFTKQEDLDFQRFSNFLSGNSNIINLKKSDGLFCHWDATYTNIISGDWIVELKNRNLHVHDKLTNDGLFIEENKFNRLLKECENGKKAIYVNLMKGNKLIVFIINEELKNKTEISNISMNKFTFGYGKKVNKSVRLLKPEMGMIYNG